MWRVIAQSSYSSDGAAVTAFTIPGIPAYAGKKRWQVIAWGWRYPAATKYDLGSDVDTYWGSRVDGVTTWSSQWTGGMGFLIWADPGTDYNFSNHWYNDLTRPEGGQSVGLRLVFDAGEAEVAEGARGHPRTVTHTDYTFDRYVTTGTSLPVDDFPPLPPTGTHIFFMGARYHTSATGITPPPGAQFFQATSGVVAIALGVAQTPHMTGTVHFPYADAWLYRASLWDHLPYWQPSIPGTDSEPEMEKILTADLARVAVRFPESRRRIHLPDIPARPALQRSQKRYGSIHNPLVTTVHEWRDEGTL